MQLRKDPWLERDIIEKKKQEKENDRKILDDDCTRCAYVLCKVPKNGCKKSFYMKYYEKFRYK